MVSIYGSTGFIGNKFCQLYPDIVFKQKRNERKPRSNNILYFISTVDNYNVYKDITLDVETNLKVLCEVLDHCRDKQIIFNFISSWFVYGNVELPAKEDYYCNPTGFYSITKKAAEDLLISFCKTYGVKYRILRLCNVVGSGDKKISSKKNAITYMIQSLKNNEDIYLYDNGESIRDIMHVDDVCRAIKLICDKGNLDQVYNIGSGHPTKIYDIMVKAKQFLNSTSNIRTKETPKFHKIVQTKDFWMDTAKLKNLGFNQKITLEKIIEELCTN